MKPEMLDPRITRFMILSHGRSGTMMLADALDESPRVKLFNLFSTNIERPQQYWLNWERFQQQKVGEVTHVGTTMHRVGQPWLARFPQYTAEQFWRELRDRHEKVICLYRRNVLRQLLSRKVGQVLGTYKVDKPRTRQPEPVSIPVQELTDYINDLEELRRRIDVVFSNRFDLAYEDLAEEWNSCYSQVEKYLGLPVSSQQPVTVRQETRLLQQAISNYTEIASWCKHTGHDDWLDKEYC